MRRSVKIPLGLSILLLFILWMPSSVLAESLSTQFGGQPLQISEKQHVENVMAVGTDVHIDGSVRDVVLVIRGNVILTAQAETDLIIVIGGHVDNPSQRQIKTGIIAFDFTQPLLNQLLIGGTMVLGIWFLRLVLSLTVIVLLTGLGYLFYPRFEVTQNLLETSAPRLFGIGSVALVISTVLMILLSLTLVGLPLAFLIFIGSVLIVLLGLIPLVHLFGKKLLSPRILDYHALTQWLILATGFVAILNLPIVGQLILLGTGITGFGLILTMGWLAVKRRKVRP